MRRGLALALSTAALPAAGGLGLACNAILGNVDAQPVDGGSNQDAMLTDAAGDATRSDAALDGGVTDANGADDACVHSCLGGACSNGTCQPVVVAQGYMPYGIAVDDSGVYWTNNGTNGHIEGCPAGPTTCADGGKVTIAAPFGFVTPDQIVAVGSQVYWDYDDSNGGGIRQCTHTDCDGGIVGTTPAAPVAGVASDGTSVFTLGSVGATTVYSCPVGGCSGGALQVFATLSQAGLLITADALDVFWTTVTAVQGCSSTACPSPQTVAAPTGAMSIHGIALDAANVYFTDTQAGNVYSCPRPGCGANPTLLMSGELSPGQMAADGTSVYWTTPNEIHGCPITGCGPKPRIVAADQVQPTGIAVDDLAVYWTTPMNGTVWKVAK